MLRVVADTNIYISAYAFGGISKEVLVMAQTGEIALFVSPAILDELEDVFVRKFKLSGDVVQEIIGNIPQFTELVTPKKNIKFIAEDPDDDRILECAVAAGANVIVSGDKDLKRIGMYENIIILSPGDFIARYGSKAA